MPHSQHLKLWVGWFVFSRRPWFWSIKSIYNYTYIMYYKCILSIWNKLFLSDIYIPRVGVAMTVCWIMRYCYSLLLGFNCILHMHTSGSSAAPNHSLWDRLLGVHCSGVMCHYVFLLLIVLFHNDFSSQQWAAQTLYISSWIITTNCWLYCNISQMLLLYKTPQIWFTMGVYGAWIKHITFYVKKHIEPWTMC